MALSPEEIAAAASASGVTPLSFDRDRHQTEFPKQLNNLGLLAPAVAREVAAALTETAKIEPAVRATTQAAAAADRAATSADGDERLAADHRRQTGEDRAQTGRDRTAIGGAVEATARDAAAAFRDAGLADEDARNTKADRIETAKHVVLTAGDREQTRLDRIATGEDRIAVGVLAAEAAKFDPALYATKVHDHSVGTTAAPGLTFVGLPGLGLTVGASNVPNDALRAVASSGGAGFQVQNRDPNGFAGIEYVDAGGAVRVFTGYSSVSKEFRFNNLAPGGALSFRTGDVERLKIAADGKIGIGTANPTSELHFVSERTAGLPAHVTFEAGKNAGAAASVAFQRQLIDQQVLFAFETASSEDPDGYIGTMPGQPDVLWFLSQNGGSGSMAIHPSKGLIVGLGSAFADNPPAAIAPDGQAVFAGVKVGVSDVWHAGNLNPALKADLVEGKIPESQLPAIAIKDTFPVADEAEMLALVAERGDMAVRADLSKSFVLRAEPASTLDNWIELRSPGGGVQSVAGKVGHVSLVAGDIGGLPPFTTSGSFAGLSLPVELQPQTTLHLGGPSDPAIRLQEDGAAGYGELCHRGPGQTTLGHVSPNGQALIDLSPRPLDGTSSASFRFFRETNTQGRCGLDIHVGNGSFAVNHRLDGNGHSYLAMQEGRRLRVGRADGPVCTLDVAGPVRVGGYTVAALPRAAVGAGQIAYVTDVPGLVVSEGDAWRRVVALEVSGKLPPLDGSQLTNLPAGGKAWDAYTTLSDATTVLVDLSLGPNFVLNAAAPRTISFTNLAAGRAGLVFLSAPNPSGGRPYNSIDTSNAREVGSSSITGSARGVLEYFVVTDRVFVRYCGEHMAP